MNKVYKRGEDIFLYVQFKDENNNPIDISNAMVRITYEKDNEIKELLPWQDLEQMSNNEYYFNFLIPDDASYTIYQIEYEGQYTEQIGARIVENFYVIPSSDSFDSAIKVYGYVHQLMTGYPLIGVDISIESKNDSSSVSKTYTGEGGIWEVYLYPGEYIFKFNKFGFKEQSMIIQLGSSYNEIQFDNVALESQLDEKKGLGVFKVNDKYTTKEGVPLNNLSIKAFNAYNPTIVFGEDTTNINGEWELFLDPGMYLLKVNGTSLSNDFNQIFRVKVSQNGEFSFENLNENVAVPQIVEDIGRGNGLKEVTDVVTDASGNPIIDVQVSVYNANNNSKIIAQDYTDVGGKWTVFLDPGKYTIVFYHPDFHEFKEERQIV